MFFFYYYYSVGFDDTSLEVAIHVVVVAGLVFNVNFCVLLCVDLNRTVLYTQRYQRIRHRTKIQPSPQLQRFFHRVAAALYTLLTLWLLETWRPKRVPGITFTAVLQTNRLLSA